MAMTSGNDKSPPPDRIWNDSAEGLKVVEPTDDHSEEAMGILIEHGVDAYRDYLSKKS